MSRMEQPTSQQRHLVNWCMWKVVLPFCILFLIWPMYSFGGVSDPFTQAFDHGDLLIFAALLFIEVALESAESSGRLSVRQYAAVEASKVGAMVLLFALAFMKYDVVKSATDEKKIAYSVVSLSFAVLAVTLSVWSLLKSMDNATSRELRAAGIEPE